MTTPIRHRSLGITITLICTSVVFGVRCETGSGPSGFAQAQVDCQAASALLTQCCPGFQPTLLACDITSTESTTGGCYGGSSTTTIMYPTLTATESSCVLGESCSMLVASGVCDRALELQGSVRVTTVTVPPPSVGCGGGFTFDDDGPEFEGGFSLGDGFSGEGGTEGGSDGEAFEAGEGGSVDGASPVDAAGDIVTVDAFGFEGGLIEAGAFDAMPFEGRAHGDRGASEGGAEAGPPFTGSICP